LNIYHYKTIQTRIVETSKNLSRDAFRFFESAHIRIDFGDTNQGHDNVTTLQLEGISVMSFEVTQDTYLYNIAGHPELANTIEHDIEVSTVTLDIKRGNASHRRILPGDSGENAHVSGSVCFRFTDSQGAHFTSIHIDFLTYVKASTAFAMGLEAMTEELYHLQIQYPRTNEQIMVRIYAPKVCIRFFEAASRAPIELPDVEVIVAYKSKKRKGRLLIRTVDNTACLSQRC